MKAGGPRPTTGVFDTREELVQFIRMQREAGRMQKDIATDAGISPALVSNIVRSMRPATKPRVLRLVR